jgi:cysteinyl-tRNA synthetase
MVDGAKMSKSKGTFFTPRELMAKGIDPAAIRLELIKTHYRANADFSMQGVKDSSRTVERFRKDARDLMAAIADPTLSYTMYLYEVIEEFCAALHDDLNIAQAIGMLNRHRSTAIVGDESGPGESIESQEGRLVQQSQKQSLPSKPMASDAALTIAQDENRSDNERSLATLHLIDNILGVIFRPVAKSQDTGIAVYLPGTTPSDEVETLLAERRDAKKAKDFARSDAIRDQLAGMGYAIKDMPGGRVEVGPA